MKTSTSAMLVLWMAMLSVVATRAEDAAIAPGTGNSPVSTPPAIIESIPVAAPAEPAAPPANQPAEVYVGRVTGDSVYIRSGPSTNYYPVTKVNRDQLVRVVGREHGWLQISPPRGCYSLVDKTFVDRGADGKGVINGDSVWIHTGSLIPEHARKKYAKQVKVNRGTVLTLIDDTEVDGFYKILSPQDAHVWISEEFVEKISDAPAFVWSDGVWVSPVGDTLATKAGGKGPTTQPAGLTDTATKAEAVSVGSPAKGDRPSRPTATQPTDRKAEDRILEADSQKLIAEIEKDLEVELKKPLGERNLNPFITRFQPIARQEGESVSKIYAQQRIQQLKDQIDSIEAVTRVNSLARELVETRQRFAEQRQSVVPMETLPDRQYDVRGQFAKSMVYDNPVGPRRYRIIDPNSVPARTLAYVEVPAGKEFNPDQYQGRFVGIRATARRLQQGVVKPLPIFLLGDISLLDSKDVLVQAPAGDLSRGTPGAGLEDVNPPSQDEKPGASEKASTPAESTPADAGSKEKKSTGQ